MERDSEKVRWDVINGYVSIDGAREDYGVEIDPVTFDVNPKATERLRNGK